MTNQTNHTYVLSGNVVVQEEATEDTTYPTTEYETVITIPLRRDDGVAGDIWAIAGVPESMIGTAQASGSQRGLRSIWLFGDCQDMWCPAQFRDDPNVVETVRGLFWDGPVRQAAIAAHIERVRALTA